MMMMHAANIFDARGQTKVYTFRTHATAEILLFRHSYLEVCTVITADVCLNFARARIEWNDVAHANAVAIHLCCLSVLANGHLWYRCCFVEHSTAHHPSRCGSWSWVGGCLWNWFVGQSRLILPQVPTTVILHLLMLYFILFFTSHPPTNTKTRDSSSSEKEGGGGGGVDYNYYLTYERYYIFIYVQYSDSL